MKWKCSQNGPDRLGAENQPQSDEKATYGEQNSTKSTLRRSVPTSSQIRGPVGRITSNIALNLCKTTVRFQQRTGAGPRWNQRPRNSAPFKERSRNFMAAWSYRRDLLVSIPVRFVKKNEIFFLLIAKANSIKMIITFCLIYSIRRRINCLQCKNQTFNLSIIFN